MNKKHNNLFYHWSKCFSSLWPLKSDSNGQVTHLPRFMQGKKRWPRFVRACPTTMSFTETLQLLDWALLDMPPVRDWFGKMPVPHSAYIGAYLVKLDQSLPSMGHLRRFLVQHPALIWALGFPLYGSGCDLASGFDPEASLPSRRHFSRILREMDNGHLQTLLDGQVGHLQSLLPGSFGQTISLDTKHILAWTKENNPRQFIKKGRFDKTKQPVGDPDCKLGCKRRHNRLVTPTREGQSPQGLSVSIGEFYWGYASGAVVAKVPGWGEFVLAELTQPFDKGDVSYFFPLMEQVERRLGFRPRYGALDAAFDAFYVYDFFDSDAHDGFAAVPFSGKGSKKIARLFDEEGLPLCEAGLSMPLKFSYNDRTTAIIPYRRAKHVCPLLFPEPNGDSCPIEHKKWAKGGCSTHLAATAGSRIRHQLDREGEQYKMIYAQRTAVERIFSQAKAIGIERPKLRNQKAISNQNSLIYLLINLRTMQRVLDKLAKLAQ